MSIDVSLDNTATPMSRGNKGVKQKWKNDLNPVVDAVAKENAIIVDVMNKQVDAES